MPGLRERKIVKTQILIQKCAFQLFAERGYNQTTIEQIADAAEVSASTFFRYFHTKEAVVLYDSADQIVFEAFTKQPSHMPIISAMKNAINEAYRSLPPERLKQEQRRFALIGSIPTLQKSLFSEAVTSIDLFANLIANRTKKRTTDLTVRNLAAAMVGVLIGVINEACKHPSKVAINRRFDSALTQFEKSWKYE